MRTYVHKQKKSKIWSFKINGVEVSYKKVARFLKKMYLTLNPWAHRLSYSWNLQKKYISN